VVHLAQQKALKVHHIARDLERHDLPPAAGQELVAADEAFQDHPAVAGAVAFGNNVLVCPDLATRVIKEAKARFSSSAKGPNCSSWRMSRCDIDEAAGKA
jgi:hypothetical protein